MKGLEPSTFCMARTMRERTATVPSRQTTWLWVAPPRRAASDDSNRQPNLASNLASRARSDRQIARPMGSVVRGFASCGSRQQPDMAKLQRDVVVGDGLRCRCSRWCSSLPHHGSGGGARAWLCRPRLADTERILDLYCSCLAWSRPRLGRGGCPARDLPVRYRSARRSHKSRARRFTATRGSR